MFHKDGARCKIASEVYKQEIMPVKDTCCVPLYSICIEISLSLWPREIARQITVCGIWLVSTMCIVSYNEHRLVMFLSLILKKNSRIQR